VSVRGVRTQGPMAPEISLARQRPAQFPFSAHVEHKLAEIRVTEARAKTTTAA
jgi:hypothetical protein